uniref:Putative serine/threonine protein kinase with Sel1 repeat n=1 Tax=Magnetococcus massalia (strain MO-1) TaxID=451514 RepID=A0A1S7LER6_MAGMO|nr:putative serine/threonine protein kinase with Sel1 repeat [Candidatus Magnetococcus massalia]
MVPFTHRRRACVSDALPNGTTIGAYHLLHPLYRLSQSILYLAQDATGQRCIIKEFYPHHLLQRKTSGRLQPIGDVEPQLERERTLFLHEYNQLAGFRHRHLITAEEQLELPEGLFLRLVHHEGERLDQRLARRGLTTRELINLAHDLGSAVQDLHKADLLHLAIQPYHLLIDVEGMPKLSSFNYVHRRHDPQRPLAIQASPYCSPELAMGRTNHLGPWSDLYSIGAMLYEGISGFPPCYASVRYQYVKEEKWRDPLIPAVTLGKGRYPEQLLRAIDAALQMEPSARPNALQPWLDMLLPLTEKGGGELNHQTMLLKTLYEGDLAWCHDDMDGAQKAYSAAASHGSANALLALADLKLNGTDKPDRVMAAVWFQRAATLTEPVAMYQLGHMFATGDEEFPAKPLEAKKWFAQAAKKFFAPALNELAHLHLADEHDEMGMEKALQCLQLAAGQGEPEAQFILGDMVRDGQARKLKLQDANRWFNLAADQDYAPALVRLGEIYGRGERVTQDHHRAFIYYKRAADQQDLMAMVRMGTALVEGVGVSSNRALGYRLIEKAAEVGLVEGHYQYGRLLLGEDAGQRNVSEAKRWLEEAAAQYHPEAMDTLGKLYEGRLLGKANPQQAVYWFNAAAELGLPSACYNLARLLERGVGVELDLKAAHSWLVQAHQGGHPYAGKRLRALEKQMGLEPSRGRKRPRASVKK